MPNWISIDPDDLDVSEHRIGRGGVEYISGLSPDDIPEKVACYIDQESKEHVIAFKYLTTTNEPRIQLREQRLAPGGHVIPVVGQHSHRLYELRITLPSPEWNLQIGRTIDALSQDNRFAKRTRHYRVAAEAVTDHAAQLAPCATRHGGG